MATPTKAANGIARKTAPPSSAAVGTVDLSFFVRENAPRIISALDCAAQQASVSGNWSERQAYLNIAEGLITNTGLYTTVGVGGGSPRGMAMAAAGAGT